MWDQVTVPFAKLLGTNLYPTLFGNKDYEEFLGICGITPPFPDHARKLSDSQRQRLAEYAHLRANLLALELNGLDALKQARSAAVEISGPNPIYRLCNSEVAGSEMRFFWFSEDLLIRSFREGGKTKALRMEWLRAHLAVAYNWSRCDQVARMRLLPKDRILAVRADGLPMRGVEIRKSDQTVRLPGDYFQNFARYSAVLPGGDPQFFLYLLPKDRIDMYW